MNNYILRGEQDVHLMRGLIEELPRPTTIADFEENMLVGSIRARTRIWEEAGQVIGFAYVDNFNNLWFEIKDGRQSEQLEREIIEWGVRCVQERNVETGEDNSLDASLSAENSWQIAILEKHGFEEDSFRTLRFGRSLDDPIRPYPFPVGFSLRCVEGEHEVERLVALHRAAFGTAKMTVEKRLAIMRGPAYERGMDLLAVAPGGELAAFCICSIEQEEDGSGRPIGYTDPIGTHPDYQGRGLGKAIVSAGMRMLKEKGAMAVFFGTSSENVAMQGLGKSLGFECVAEKLWFSRKVGMVSVLRS